MELVTVATFDNMPAAHIAKDRLEIEGIPCWLKDEHLGQTDWLYNIAVGWIKLQVDAAHGMRARAILDTDYSDQLRAEGDCRHACTPEPLAAARVRRAAAAAGPRDRRGHRRGPHPRAQRPAPHQPHQHPAVYARAHARGAARAAAPPPHRGRQDHVRGGGPVAVAARAPLVAGARRERRGTRARRAATGPRPHPRHAPSRRMGDDGTLQLRALSAHEPLSPAAHAGDGCARAPRARTFGRTLGAGGRGRRARALSNTRAWRGDRHAARSGARREE